MDVIYILLINVIHSAVTVIMLTAESLKFHCNKYIKVFLNTILLWQYNYWFDIIKSLINVCVASIYIVPGTPPHIYPPRQYGAILRTRPNSENNTYTCLVAMSRLSDYSHFFQIKFFYFFLYYVGQLFLIQNQTCNIFITNNIVYYKCYKFIIK